MINYYKEQLEKKIEHVNQCFIKTANTIRVRTAIASDYMSARTKEDCVLVVIRARELVAELNELLATHQAAIQFRNGLKDSAELLGLCELFNKGEDASQSQP